MGKGSSGEPGGAGWRDLSPCVAKDSFTTEGTELTEKKINPYAF
jgi:hypothetical protein